MGTLKTQVEDLIHAEFPGSVVELEEIPLSEKLSGSVVWEGFATQPQPERQRQLRGFLREKLSPELYRELSILLAISPSEIKALRDYA